MSMSSSNIEHSQNENHTMSSTAMMTNTSNSGASAAATAAAASSLSSLSNYNYYWPEQPQQQHQMMGMQGSSFGAIDEDTMMASHIAKSIVEQIIQEESNPFVSFLHESKQDEQFVNNNNYNQHESIHKGFGDTENISTTNNNTRFEQDRRNVSLARPSLSPSLEVDASTSQATSSSSNNNKRSRWGPKVIVANQVLAHHQKDEEVSFDVSTSTSSQSVTTTSNQNNPHKVTSSSLQLQQHNPLHHPHQVLQPPPTRTASNSATGRGLPSTTTPEEARIKREQYIQMFDRPRKHAALIRNFEYIHEKEEQALKQQLNQLQESKNSKQPKTKQRISNKNQALLTSKAGLGTKQRNLAVKTFDKVSGLDQNRQSTFKEQTTTTTTTTTTTNDVNKAGFYITGLTPFTKEESIRQLFQSFGSIERVTLYKHKSTGRLKGDALVVLSYPNDTNSGSTTAQPLDVDGICQQLNGCVLPSCGSCLKVQPADMEWKTKKVKQQVQKQMFHGTHDKVERLLYGASGGSTLTSTSVDDTNNNSHDNPRTDNGSHTCNSTTTIEQQKSILKDDDGGDGGEQGEQQDEDLDDFFASLED